MKPTKLLESIREAGLSLSILPGGLLAAAPAKKITPEIRQAIRQHKAELVMLLSGDQKKNPARTWTPGNPFFCSCGHATGWQLDVLPLCPVCYHKQGRDEAVTEPLQETPATPHGGLLPDDYEFSPAPCKGCSHCEVIMIEGQAPMAGCVKRLDAGEWSEIWKRLPADLQRCILH